MCVCPSRTLVCLPRVSGLMVAVLLDALQHLDGEFRTAKKQNLLSHEIKRISNYEQ